MENSITNLQSELIAGREEFIGETIDISGSGVFLTQNSLGNISKLSFQDCIFTGSYLEFEDIDLPEFLLGFDDCTFQIQLKIKNCNFKRIKFLDTKEIKSIGINGGNLSRLHFRNNNLAAKNNNALKGTVSLSHLTIQEVLHIDNLNLIDGSFDFSENTINNKILKKSTNPKNATFENSTFYDFSCSDSTFGEETIFENIEILHNGSFLFCTFQKVYFSNSDFGDAVSFELCDFLGTTLFDAVQSIETSALTFTSCKFYGFAHYSNSEINSLSIKYTTFERPASFKEVQVNDFILSEVKFEKGAYFDDIKIENVSNGVFLKGSPDELKEWKHTLRLIKQEVQKTENKFDFNRFRNYELETHYTELKWNRKNFIDKSILFSTKWSSNFGNWFWALGFTLISGFVWYFLFYIAESDCRCFSKDFFVGFFRFLLVTDFYNPLTDERVFLDSIESWIFFILGKIFIAFGIYEMIQSFRKFKA